MVGFTVDHVAEIKSKLSLIGFNKSPTHRAPYSSTILRTLKLKQRLTELDSAATTARAQGGQEY